MAGETSGISSAKCLASVCMNEPSRFEGYYYNMLV